MEKAAVFVELVKHLKDITLSRDKQLFTTIICDFASSLLDVGTVAPCSYKETATRLFLHVAATTFPIHHRVIVSTINGKQYYVSRRLEICCRLTVNW